MMYQRVRADHQAAMIRDNDRMKAHITSLTAERDRLRAALEAINRLASPSPYRTFDECSADLNWCANEARRALAPTPPPAR